MTLSGNRNSLKSYNARLSSQKLQVCSNVLSSELTPQATQADQKMQVFRGNQQQLQQSRSTGYDFKPAKGTMSDSTSQPCIFSGCQTGKFNLLSRAIKQSDIHLDVLSLKNRKFFEHSFCFHRTLGIFSYRFRRIQS